ncbi:peptidoglycan-binding protein [Pelovirga terrestris]|uniref:Peptidoglycan-binding protein n=1 Tax=Pelovirga terrestris TaxID=2771352 RepID=A0A8J6QPZ0_9BACT|nr:peptidoglycan-binding protein [Pelovirga terrestris]
MHNNQPSKLMAFIFTLVLLLSAATAHTADGEGQFAVRGAGLISCALYTQERAARSEVYLVAAAWVDGYITGINQHASQTYDLMSFESTELLMAILDNHCQKNPSDPIFGVLVNLFKKLWPDRLIDKSDKTTIAIGEREARHYVESIGRVQNRLQAAGFYKDPRNNEYSPQTLEAMKKFQTSIGFEPTGFPDQLTLWRLMRNEADLDK